MGPRHHCPLVYNLPKCLVCLCPLQRMTLRYTSLCLCTLLIGNAESLPGSWCGRLTAGFRWSATHYTRNMPWKGSSGLVPVHPPPHWVECHSDDPPVSAEMRNTIKSLVLVIALLRLLKTGPDKHTQGLPLWPWPEVNQNVESLVICNPLICSLWIQGYLGSTLLESWQYYPAQLVLFNPPSPPCTWECEEWP